jgi:hypothetical protein
VSSSLPAPVRLSNLITVSFSVLTFFYLSVDCLVMTGCYIPPPNTQDSQWQHRTELLCWHQLLNKTITADHFQTRRTMEQNNSAFARFALG